MIPIKHMTGSKSKFIILEFAIRLAVFTFILTACLRYGDIAAIISDTPFFSGFSAALLVWILMMAGMIMHLFPMNAGFTANNRQFGDTPQDGREVLRVPRSEARKMNGGARKVLALWIGINAVVAFLYLNGMMGASGIILIVAVFYLCDAVCMFVWCPLQQFFMKTRCCANCRIYGWGHFLVYAPLFMIVDVLTWSLAVMALILLIRWEVVYSRHTERFWAGTNPALRCANCTERSCEFKKYISSLWHRR